MARTADAQVSLITGASGISAGAFDTEATRTTVSTTRSFVDLVLTCTFAVAPAVGDTVSVYRRDMNIDGTTDAPTPTLTNFEHKYVGSLVVDVSTASQSLPLNGIWIPNDADFHLLNDSGQAINSGWTLKAITWDWA